MKKHYITLACGILLLLSAGCKEKAISRKNIILDNEKHYDFGVLFYQDIDDNTIRITMYDNNTYDYIQIGDTVVLKMSEKTFRKEYKKHNLMYPEEMTIDPDSVLYKKNQILEQDSLVQAKREMLHKRLLVTPIQIVASKAERIQR